MKLIDFIKNKKLSINAFAAENKLPATTVWRAVIGKPVRPCNAMAIEQATDGAVTRMELLYPKEKS